MFSEAWTHIVTSQVKPKTLGSLPLQTQFNQCERSRIKMLNIYYLSWLVDFSLLFVMYVCDFRWFISNHFKSNHLKLLFKCLFMQTILRLRPFVMIRWMSLWLVLRLDSFVFWCVCVLVCLFVQGFLCPKMKPYFQRGYPSPCILHHDPETDDTILKMSVLQAFISERFSEAHKAWDQHVSLMTLAIWFSVEFLFSNGSPDRRWSHVLSIE